MTSLALAGLMGLTITGCQPGREARADRCRVSEPLAAVGRPALAPSLLFDRRPGRYHASQFAVGSDWPAAAAFYSPGQVLVFRERFVDTQSRGVGESDWLYRRFDMQRVGIGFRP